MVTLEEFESLLAQGRYQEALAAARQWMEAPAAVAQYEPAAHALRNYADLESRRSIAEKMYRTVIELQRKVHGEISEPVWVGWWSLAHYLDQQGRREESLQAYQKMIAIAEQLSPAEPALLEMAKSRYADLVGRMGDLQTAERLLRDVITSLKRIDPAREERENRMGKKGPDLGQVLTELRRNLSQQGKVEEADRVFDGFEKP